MGIFADQLGFLFVRHNGLDGDGDVGGSRKGWLGRTGVQHRSTQLTADVFGGMKFGGIEVLHRTQDHAKHPPQVPEI